MLLGGGHLRRAALVPARARRPAGPQARRWLSARELAGDRAAGDRRRPTRPRRRAAAGRRRPARASRPAPTASSATRPGQRRSTRRRGAYGGHGRKPEAAAATSPLGRDRSPSAATATAQLPRARRSATRSAAGSTVVAVPLREADETLDRLLLVEALVIGGVLVAARHRRPGSSCASACGRSTAWATPPGAIAGGDLSHRVEATDPRTEVGRLGLALNAMLDRLEEAFAERQASEDRLRAFLADASHELRTPLASIRGYAELFRMGAAREPAERRAGDAPDRGRGRAHGRARRGPADARAPRRGRRRAARRASTSPRSRATPSTTRARPRPTARSTLDADGAGAGASATRTSCARCSATCCATRSCTRRPGTPIEVSVAARGPATSRVEVRDHGPGLPDGRPRRAVRALLARRGRPRARQGRRRARAWRSSPAIVDAHGGRCGPATRTAAARRSSSSCPLSGSSEPPPGALPRGRSRLRP